MATVVYAWAPLHGGMKVAARLEWEAGQGRFRYSPEWLAAQEQGAYALDPRNLPLGEATTTLTENHGIPGVFADAGPDRWGRLVIERLNPHPPRNPAQWVLHTDGAGTGALRFSGSRSALGIARTVYSEVTLEQLEEASRAVAQGGFPPPPMREILCIASGALGGARPKAAMRWEGKEYIAKFENPQHDTVNMPRLEWACMRLASELGLDTASVMQLQVHGRSVLLVKRFDRGAGLPLHYLSARSLLAVYRAGERDMVAPEGRATYPALAAAARHLDIAGAGPQLFRRMALNYALGNTDDHLQNHGLLHEDGRWRLCPVFDVVATGGDQHAIGLGRLGREGTRANVLSAADLFGLSGADASTQLDLTLDAARHRLPQLLDDAEMPAAERQQALSRRCPEARTPAHR